MPEAWRSVSGFEGRYEVSDLGRVRSLDRILRDGRRWKGRVLRQVPDNHGYPQVNLCRDMVQKTLRVSKLVADAFLGPRIGALEVCHANRNPMDNRLVNLRWDTRSGNMQDALAHGTQNMVRRTHCPRGHVLAPPNLQPYKAALGWRECLACHKARAYTGYRKMPFDPDRADRIYEAIMGAETSEAG